MTHARRTTLVLMALTVLSACAAARGGGGPARPIGCPAASFYHPTQVREITVDRFGLELPLGHGHGMVFPEGSVPRGSTFRVSRASGEHAALRIVPVGNAPREFQRPVELRMSFAPCGTGVERRPGLGIYRWEEDDALRPRPGRVVGQRIEATLDGLSVYAIGSN